MKRPRLAGERRPLCWVMATLLATGMAHLSAQLAITEVMSSAATNLYGRYAKGSDWWELTNFGTNALDLTGYSYSDRSNEPKPQGPFMGITIGPGESIIIVRTKELTNVWDFCDWWWGDSGCPPGLQVIMGPHTPGFSSDGDSVRLWDSQENLVDSADFGIATPGKTFVYDTNTGCFDALSECGVNCAFQAARSSDCGSPGCTMGPVPIQLVMAPVGLTVDEGMLAVFSVRASGLPRPRFQWRFNDLPLGPGISSFACPPWSRYCLADAQPESQGSYWVEVNNGLETLISPAANLTVSLDPKPPYVVRPPLDAATVEDNCASFTVVAGGVPAPGYQWLSNGVALPGGTRRTLTVENVGLTQSGTTYSVQITNQFGATNASAKLSVTPQSELRITEVMGFACTNTPPVGREDWWELTNYGTNVIQLRGYQFLDRPNLTAALTVTNDVRIRPGESVVFVQRLTPEQFIAWWGESNLPPKLQILTYHGFGISEMGDSIYLWNPAAGRKCADNPCGLGEASEDWAQTEDSVSFARFDPGTSLWFSPFCPNTDFGVSSEAGQCGAFRSAQSCDVGSPGWTPWAVRGLAITPLPPWWGVALTCESPLESTNVVLCKTNLNDPVWRPAGRYTNSQPVWTFTDNQLGDAPRHFYRLLLEGATPGALPPPRITSLLWVPEHMTLAWWSPPGTTNLVLYRTNRSETNWTVVARRTAPDAFRTLTLTNPNPAIPRFYRVVVDVNCNEACTYTHPWP